MIYERGNIWSVYRDTDHLLFTANSCVKADGSLVMGAGIAKQVRDRFPGIDRLIGAVVKATGTRFGLILGRKIGVFQTKLHWRDPSPVELIEHSTRLLTVRASDTPGERFDMTMPGCSHGQLSRSIVDPIISFLPDNVHVWTY